MAAGTQIGANDLGYQSVALGAAAKNYLAASTNPIGSITRRRLIAGELLQGSSLTDDARALTHQEISLSIRAVDIPIEVAVGELISLYQLHDVRESKTTIAPEFIVSGAFVTSIDRKGLICIHERSFSGCARPWVKSLTLQSLEYVIQSAKDLLPALSFRKDGISLCEPWILIR
jgi:hypothetical protein